MKQLSLDAFLDACGARRPLCLDVTPPDGQPVQRQVLNQPFALLGRHDCADVCLRDAGVSRRHALVQRIAGHLYCLDLSSRTGTHWDGGAAGQGWITGPLHVGEFQLRVAGEDADSPAVPHGWDPAANGSLARYRLPVGALEIAKNGRAVCRWRMNRALAVVGSAPTCKVRLHGPKIGRFHCALVCTPAGIWAIDLRRHEGVSVNGTPVGHCLLEDGDLLQVGDYTILLQYEPARHSQNGVAIADARQALPVPSELLPGVAGAADIPANTELLPALLRQFSEMQHQMFDQSLLMMFQMFRTMHGDHVEGLRDQLARMDELNRELQTVLAERLKTPATLAPPPTPNGNGKLLHTAAPESPTPAPPSAKTEPPPAPAKPAPLPPPAAESGQDLHVWLCQRMETIQEERHGLWQRIVGSLRKKE